MLKYVTKKYPTKIFSYPINYNTIGNDTAFIGGIKRYGLNLFEIYKSKTLDTHFVTKKINDINVKLSDMLLPDLDLDFKNEDYVKVLNHEGYQLKWFKVEENFYR